MIVMSESYLRAHWEKSIRLRGAEYRVGRMSYGDWFLEPKPWGGERDGFASGTLWPVRIIGTVNYRV